jgi:hypothetical protein
VSYDFITYLQIHNRFLAVGRLNKRIAGYAEAPSLPGAVEHVGPAEPPVDFLVEYLLEFERRGRPPELQHLNKVGHLVVGRRIAGLDILKQPGHDALVAGQVGDVAFLVALLDHKLGKVVRQPVVDPFVDLGREGRAGDLALGDLPDLLDDMCGFLFMVSGSAAADVEIGEHAAVVDPLAHPVFLPLGGVELARALPHLAHQFGVLHAVGQVEVPALD